MLTFIRKGADSAHTLVFMHYLGGSARTWLPVIDRLTASHDCLSLDMAGFGGSANLQPCNVATQAELVWETLNAQGIKKPYLIGHSMSGKIASLMALQHPLNVKGLMLIAPSPLTPQPMTRQQYEQQRNWQGTLGEAERLVNGSCAKPLKDALRNSTIEDALRANSAAFHHWADNGSQENVADSYGKVNVPVRLLIGTEDQNVPALSEQIKSTLIHFNPYSFSLMKGCGHLLPLEDDEKVAKEIDDFVRMTSG